MSRIELLDEGLVILPSSIAPEPTDGEIGNTAPSVFPSGAGGGVSNRPVTGLGELVDGEPFHIEPPSSNAWASSRSAVRSDTGASAWRLTPKAISHLFGSPTPPYRRVDEIPALRDPSSTSHEPDGSAKP
jgi:hypothetical protein